MPAFTFFFRGTSMHTDASAGPPRGFQNTDVEAWLGTTRESGYSRTVTDDGWMFANYHRHSGVDLGRSTLTAGTWTFTLNYTATALVDNARITLLLFRPYSSTPDTPITIADVIFDAPAGVAQTTTIPMTVASSYEFMPGDQIIARLNTGVGASINMLDNTRLTTTNFVEAGDRYFWLQDDNITGFCPPTDADAKKLLYTPEDFSFGLPTSTVHNYAGAGHNRSVYWSTSFVSAANEPGIYAAGAWRLLLHTQKSATDPARKAAISIVQYSPTCGVKKTLHSSTVTIGPSKTIVIPFTATQTTFESDDRLGIIVRHTDAAFSQFNLVLAEIEDTSSNDPNRQAIQSWSHLSAPTKFNIITGSGSATGRGTTSARGDVIVKSQAGRATTSGSGSASASGTSQIQWLLTRDEALQGLGSSGLRRKAKIDRDASSSIASLSMTPGVTYYWHTEDYPFNDGDTLYSGTGFLTGYLSTDDTEPLAGDTSVLIQVRLIRPTGGNLTLYSTTINIPRNTVREYDLSFGKISERALSAGEYISISFLTTTTNRVVTMRYGSVSPTSTYYTGFTTGLISAPNPIKEGRATPSGAGAMTARAAVIGQIKGKGTATGVSAASVGGQVDLFVELGRGTAAGTGTMTARGDRIAVATDIDHNADTDTVIFGGQTYFDLQDLTRWGSNTVINTVTLNPGDSFQSLKSQPSGGTMVYPRGNWFWRAYYSTDNPTLSQDPTGTVAIRRVLSSGSTILLYSANVTFARGVTTVLTGSWSQTSDTTIGPNDRLSFTVTRNNGNGQQNSVNVVLRYDATTTPTGLKTTVPQTTYTGTATGAGVGSATARSSVTRRSGPAIAAGIATMSARAVVVKRSGAMLAAGISSASARGTQSEIIEVAGAADGVGTMTARAQGVTVLIGKRTAAGVGSASVFAALSFRSGPATAAGTSSSTADGVGDTNVLGRSMMAGVGFMGGGIQTTVVSSMTETEMIGDSDMAARAVMTIDSPPITTSVLTQGTPRGAMTAKGLAIVLPRDKLLFQGTSDATFAISSGPMSATATGTARLTGRRLVDAKATARGFGNINGQSATEGEITGEIFTWLNGGRARSGIDFLDPDTELEVSVSQDDINFENGTVSWQFRTGTVVTGRNDSRAEVRRTANVSLFGTGTFNPLVFKYRIWTEIQRSDGKWQRFSLGVFVPTMPPVEDDGIVVRYNLDLADKTHIYAKREVDDPFTLPVKTNPIEFVKTILKDLFGEKEFLLPETDRQIDTELFFEPGTNYLEIMNTALEATGFDPLIVTEDGKPYTRLATEFATRSVLRTYEPGDSMLFESSLDPLLPESPNVLIFYARNAPTLAAEGNGIHTVRNEDIGPSSIASRGGVEVPLRVEVEAIQGPPGDPNKFLREIAEREARHYFAGGGTRLAMQVALEPRMGDRTILKVRKPRLGLDTVEEYICIGWEYPVTGEISSPADAVMQLELERRLL